MVSGIFIENERQIKVIILEKKIVLFLVLVLKNILEINSLIDFSTRLRRSS